MDANDTKDPSAESVGGAEPRVVDRHNELIGATVDPEPTLRDGPLVIDVTAALASRLDLGEGTIAVPSDWVAGLRRDEIRLSIAVHDPAFAAAVPRERPEVR